uniref:Uncharacterized protein n=1 Tax=Trichuris muris TaxID=70415 RepID=A0A5S6R2W0_TRIMR
MRRQYFKYLRTVESKKNDKRTFHRPGEVGTFLHFPTDFLGWLGWCRCLDKHFLPEVPSSHANGIERSDGILKIQGRLTGQVLVWQFRLTDDSAFATMLRRDGELQKRINLIGKSHQRRHQRPTSGKAFSLCKKLLHV